MTSNKTCIICNNIANSREHIFPAAFGGRVVNKSIYCSTHNGAFSRHVDSLDKELDILNSAIGVIPDRKNSIKETRLKDSASEEYVYTKDYIKLAAPSALDITPKTGIEQMQLRFADHNQAQKWMDKYKNEGFPKNFGLGENNILFRKHNSEKIMKLMNDWWDELNTQTKRDQLSLAYVLWKNGERFCFMDESARGNEYFNIKLHNAHVVKNCNFYNFLLEKFDNDPKMYKYCLYCLVLVKKICKVINR